MAKQAKKKRATNKPAVGLPKRQLREMELQMKLHVVGDSPLDDNMLFSDQEGEQPAVIRSLIATGNDVNSFANRSGGSDFWRSSDLHALEISKVRTLGSLSAYASKLKKLRVLEASWPSIGATTTSNLEPIGQLHGLRELSLWDCPCKNLEALKTLPKLKRLEFGGVTVKRLPLEDISALATCENLVELSMTLVEIDDLRPLSQLAKLKTLCIQNSPVSDLKPLKKLLNLRSLTLYWTGVSKLTPLRSLEKLTSLEVVPPDDIDPNEFARLEKKLPKCKINAAYEALRSNMGL